MLERAQGRPLHVQPARPRSISPDAHRREGRESAFSDGLANAGHEATLGNPWRRSPRPDSGPFMRTRLTKRTRRDSVPFDLLPHLTQGISISNHGKHALPSENSRTSVPQTHTRRSKFNSCKDCTIRIDHPAVALPELTTEKRERPSSARPSIRAHCAALPLRVGKDLSLKHM